jgi:hypothetical protein
VKHDAISTLDIFLAIYPPHIWIIILLKLVFEVGAIFQLDHIVIIRHSGFQESNLAVHSK